MIKTFWLVATAFIYIVGMGLLFNFFSNVALVRVELSDKEAAVIDCMRSYGRPAFDARFKFIGCATR